MLVRSWWLRLTAPLVLAVVLLSAARCCCLEAKSHAVAPQARLQEIAPAYGESAAAAAAAAAANTAAVLKRLAQRFCASSNSSMAGAAPTAALTAGRAASAPLGRASKAHKKQSSGNKPRVQAPPQGKADQSPNQPPISTFKVQVQPCSSAADIKQKITLEGPSCPFDYPPITVQDVLAGISKPYAFGGIDRLGCAACSQQGLWPRFCLFRKTGIRFWDDVNCNVREDFGREAVLKSVQFSSNLTLNWPGSSGMTSLLSEQAAAAAGRTNSTARSNSTSRLQSAARTFAPGPVEITPCHVWRIIRGRTLWIIGDSQMKSLYVALKCFMLEFWLDFKQYRPTWNSTINKYLTSGLKVDTEPACIHMRDSTRICQLVVTSAGAMVRGPAGPNGTTAGESIWQLLQKQLASPDDIFAMNFGLWYKSWTPAAKDFYRHHLNALGAYYKQTGAAFPNVFFLETVKLHYPYPAGEQDGVVKNTTKCAATANVEFNFSDSSLRYSKSKSGQVSAEAVDKAKEFMQFQKPKDASTGKQRRRLAGDSQQQQQQQQQQQWQQGQGNVSSNPGSHNRSSNNSGNSAVQQQTGPAAGNATTNTSSQHNLQGFNSSSSNSSNSSAVSPAYNGSRSSITSKSNTSSHNKTIKHKHSSSSNNSSSNSSSNSTKKSSSSSSSSKHNSLVAAASQGRPDVNLSSLTPEIGAAGPAPQPKTQQPKTLGADVAPPVLTPEAAAALVLAGTWRNDIAREVLRDKWGMSWVPIYNTTVPTYWGHRNQPDNPDCIHYCNPGVPQTIMSQLLLAIAVQVQPLEGQAVPDKTCMWGSEQVYDEHEQLFAETNSD